MVKSSFGKIFGIVLIICLVAGTGTILYLFWPEPEVNPQIFPDVFDITQVDDAGEALGVAQLFARSFTSESQLLVGTLAGTDTSVQKISRYLAQNPYATENFFSAVLYDSINKMGDLAGKPVVFTSFNTDVLHPLQTAMNLDMYLYGISYSGRSWGSVNSCPPILLETVAESTSEYIPSQMLYTSPIVLDLNGDGQLGASNGQWLPHPDSWSTNVKLFDMDGDGVKELTEWVLPNDGLLINTTVVGERALTGMNLFGSCDGWTNGFVKLAIFDVDHNGKLNGSELNGLYIWVDTDQNALTLPSEVQSLSELDITEIRLQHTRSKGSFIRAGATYTLWDWYPNIIFLLQKQLSGLPSFSLPPITIPALTNVLTLTAMHSPFILNKTELESLGLANSTFGYVTDLGSTVIYQKINDLAQESAGFHHRMVIISSKEDIISIPLPVKDIVTSIPLPHQGGAIVIANHGSKILEVLYSGEIRTLWEHVPGESGFRAGAHCSIIGNNVYIWGQYYTADGILPTEEIASEHYHHMEEVAMFPIGGGELKPVLNTRSLFDNIPQRTLGGSILSNTSIFSVDAAENVTIRAIENGAMVEIDTGYSFGGLWGGIHSAVYLLQRNIGESMQVCVYDMLSKEITTITKGDYAYPVIAQEGEALIVATYDYAQLRMTYWRGLKKDDYTLYHLIEDVPIGPVRISNNGKYYAFLSPDGLQLGFLDPSIIIP